MLCVLLYCTAPFNYFISVPPLFVIEFLHRVMDIFTDYFSEYSEQRIKDNYVIVYEVNNSQGYAHMYVDGSTLTFEWSLGWFL